jgi:hypothetical protein
MVMVSTLCIESGPPMPKLTLQGRHGDVVSGFVDELRALTIHVSNAILSRNTCGIRKLVELIQDFEPTFKKKSAS